jgi:putative ubiquitin-RnfH superfamily antitoxin RatB of RatAB toxin-antitoxin module
MDKSGIAVEVVYALRDRQIVLTVRVPPGTTVGEAIEQSHIARELNGTDLTHAPLGIHGRVVSRDTRLQEGDRVEIYRPLVADPKQTRRERAARQ